MITITEQEYLDYTGINLGSELKDLDDGPNKISRAIKLWTNRVYRQMTKPVKIDTELTAEQIQAIKDCICEYGEYYFRNGDLYRLSGFDEDKGVLINQDEIKKVQFPNSCIDILRSVGLIRRGLGISYKYDQHKDWY